MCDIADGTCPVWDERWVTARKSHRCIACGETVEPGHTYHRTESLYDGSWSRWKHCGRCGRIWLALLKMARQAQDDIAIDPALRCGSSWEGAWDEPPPPEVAALAFALPGDPVTDETPGIDDHRGS